MRAKGISRTIVTLLLVATALGAAPPEAPGTSPPDPNAIFDNVRRAWSAGAYPRYAQYVAVVQFHNDKKLVRRTWETTEDLRAGVVYSRPFSREEDAHPYTPHGMNISIPFLDHLSPEHQPDPIGHVAFAIDQDYGLAPGERKFASVSAAGAIEAQRSALAFIGRTGTLARDYAVSLIETATDPQGTEYHLALQPLRDPARHRLRELWVDANTWLPEEAIVEGIGNRAPLNSVRWRIEYRQTDGGTYIAREIALGSLHAKNARLDDATVTFGEVKLASHLANFGLSFSKNMPIGEP
jgi:hypothetical protein